jgi:thiol:disulfide interchange protein
VRQLLTGAPAARPPADKLLALSGRNDRSYVAVLSLHVMLSVFSAALAYLLGFEWEGAQHQQQHQQHSQPFNPFSHQGKLQQAAAASGSGQHPQGSMMAKLYP